MISTPLPRRRFLKKGMAAAVGAAAFPLASSALISTESVASGSAGAHPFAPPQDASAIAPAAFTAARIKIDFDRRIGAIDRNIYGNFIEHLGRCIYGGIYDESSPLSDSDGFRKDVLEAVRGLHLPILRWPGGNFSSGYNWKDGIGPKDSRPRRWDTAWQAEESNRFGTDEFIEYCRKIDAEPYITINMGTGTMQDAADWVEYCNATTDTYWANLRKKNGHAEPYNVKYWGLGNELYGPWQAGRKSAQEYGPLALEYAKMMRWIDPDIKLVACGGPTVEWNRLALESLLEVVDYISLHHYCGRPSNDAHEAHDDTALARQIDVLDAVITTVMIRSERKERIKIAADEWNVWYRSWFKRNDDHKLEEVYDLRDVLWVATAMNIFHRACRSVTLADLAQLVNVIAPIMTNEKGLVLQTIYFPLKLYAEHCGSVALDALVRSDAFPEFPDTPYIDVSATTDENNQKLTLAVVNRHPTADITVDILIEGFKPAASGDLYEVNGPSLASTNTFDKPNEVSVKKRTFSGAGASFRQSFPAHSLSVMLMQT